MLQFADAHRRRCVASFILRVFLFFFASACDHEFLLCKRTICSCVSVSMCFEVADSAYFKSVHASSECVNRFGWQ